MYLKKLSVSRPDRALVRARAAQAALELALRLAHFFAFRIGSSPGRDADLTLTGLTVDGSSRVGVFQQITHLIFQAALAAPC